MNFDILIPILTLSAIAIGAGLILNCFDGSDKYDERQLIERGKGANLAMMVAIIYLLGLYIGYLFNLLHMEYMAIFAMYGFIATIIVNQAYCIFHDAFLNREQELGPTVLQNGLLGLVWLALSLFGAGLDSQGSWLRGALALAYLSESIMLLLRALILRIRDHRAEKE